ncbi:MAG: methyltransferase domain-containing protein [Acidimicrobiales bacterium]
MTAGAESFDRLPMLASVPWQMSHGERAALEGILAQLQPRLAIEIGTAQGGSLGRIAAYSDEVHSFDLVRPEEVPNFESVTFHTGDSHRLLPETLAQFADAGRSVDFVLVDGDHTADGVRRDLEDLLMSEAVRRTLIVLHDTMNDVVRDGIEAADLEGNPKVALVDLDFVPGHLSRRGPYRLQFWGGLGVVVVDGTRDRDRASPVRDDRFYELISLLRPVRDAMLDLEHRRGAVDALPAKVIEDRMREGSRLDGGQAVFRGPSEVAPETPSFVDSRGQAGDVSPRSGEVPERFVPERMHGELLEAEHVLRYSWSTRFCAGRRVLDAGCGVGYGAALLMDAGAATVMAVDVSHEAVALAREVAPAGMTCEAANLESLPYREASFDLVACFEVIEHVRDPDKVLDELARVLAPGGLLLISSPNRARNVPGNPHHVHEYLPRELRAALERRFAAVRLCTQHVMLASVLSGREEHEVLADATVRREIEPDEEDELYSVAIAGDVLPDPGPTAISLTHFVEMRRWVRLYDDQLKLLRDQERALMDLESIKRDRREALELLAERETSDAEVPGTANAERMLTVSNRELEASLAGTRRLVDDMQSSVSWRVTSPLRGAIGLVRRLRG